MNSPTYALITGASSGIGFALCERALEKGYIPIMVSRTNSNMEAAVNRLQLSTEHKIQSFCCDIGCSDQLDELIVKLHPYIGDIEILINCAGVGYGGEFIKSDYKQEMSVVNVNVLSQLRLSHYFSVLFAQRQHGYIMNVSSLAAFQSGPYFANYYASKAYVLHFTEALSYELRNSGVKVTALCPGTTGTRFHHKAGIESTELAKGIFGIVMTPSVVSHIGFNALMKGRTVVVPGRVNAMAAFLVRLTPRYVVTAIVNWINKPRQAMRVRSVNRSNHKIG